MPVKRLREKETDGGMNDVPRGVRNREELVEVGMVDVLVGVEVDEGVVVVVVATTGEIHAVDEAFST